MLFLIQTREVYHMVYQVEAATPEEAIATACGPYGTEYVLPEVTTAPAKITVTDIQAVVRPKEEAA